mgnify:FL=1|tara:strand:- start:880 stop:1179 length:300 start_codon:yes stop_codon:yes gene_type:complete
MSEFDRDNLARILTKDQQRRNKQPKVTLESIKKTCNFFDETNPVTYKIYLQKRPDLDDEEREYYLDLIQQLEAKADEDRAEINGMMRDSREVFAEMNSI